MAPHAKQTIAGISVYVPTGAIDTRSKRLAPRLATLRGTRIGILDNCKEFADIVLRGVAAVLEREHGAAEIRFWRKSYLGIPSPYAEEMAAHCDAVINGVGHWGSSTPWTARDAAALEDLGIPTVTVISTAFAPLGQVVGEGIGHVSLPIVVVPHPLGHRDENVIRKYGEDIAQQCVRVLTTPADVLAREFEAKRYPLPDAVMPR